MLLVEERQVVMGWVYIFAGWSLKPMGANWLSIVN